LLGALPSALAGEDYGTLLTILAIHDAEQRAKSPGNDTDQAGE